jgi:hypothetical protein
LGIPKHTPPLPPHPVKVPWPVEPAKIEEKKTRGGEVLILPRRSENALAAIHFWREKRGGKKSFFHFQGNDEGISPSSFTNPSKRHISFIAI